VCVCVSQLRKKKSSGFKNRLYEIFMKWSL